jgi:DNA-binding winged helix-turn-helix (wHTH) protein/tetratricopeptide (TPR) repeat protein
MRLPRYRFGEFELDPASRELSRFGERIGLRPKSFECLVYLIAHRDRAVGRDELISAVWGRTEVSDTVVSQTLLRARRAVDDTGDRQSTVRTVPCFGYRWVATVEEISPEEASVPTPASTPTPSPAPAPVTAPEHVASSPLAAPGRAGMWLIGFALIAVALGWILLRERPASTTGMAALVLVLPVAVSPADSENAWVRLGAMDYVANRLRHSGLKVVPSDQTLHLSAQLGGQALSAATLQKLQAASGARWILAPEAELDRRGWRMRMTLLEGHQQRVLEGRGSTALAAAAAVSDSWLRRIGRRSTDSETTPSRLTERVQQIDAELLAGQLGAARRLVDAAPKAEQNDARLRVRAGQIEYRAGRIDDAAAIFSQVLERQPKVPDGLRAKALMGLGAVEIRRENFIAVEAYYTQALAVLEAAPAGVVDPADLGNAYNGRGVGLVQQGKMEAAIRDMGMAQIAMQRSGNVIEAAGVATNLGTIETRRGHYAQALQEFDGSIAVFERFDVRDYTAASLLGKTETQLELVQPSAAAASIQRASELATSLEDPYLASGIEFVQTRALLETGRLRDAERSLVRLKSLGIPESDPRWQELNLRLRLSLDVRTAGVLARRHPAPVEAVPGSLALAAVQAALLNHQFDTAQSWLSHAPANASTTDVAWTIARALLAQSEGRGDSALQLARQAMAIAELTGSPRDRVRTGVLLARLLLAQGQNDAAAAVLGDLNAFVALDYRVAWATLDLYRKLGDQGMVVDALKRVQTLRGERDIAMQPLL